MVVALILAAMTLNAQSPAAIEKQRASVRRQVSDNPSSSFFTVPWVSPAVGTTAPLPQAFGDCEPVSAADLSKIVMDAAQREGINPSLIRAVIKRESAGRPCAVSSKGAEGMMQLMPATQSDLGVQDSFDPVQNVGGGAKYLKQLLARYKGNLELALAAYNAGPQRVDEGNKVPEIAETQAYVAAILAELKREEEAAAQ